MSQTPPSSSGPFASPNPFGAGPGRPLPTPDFFEPPVGQRTSVLAIFSLVLGLLCFLPVVPGALALILGGAAVVLIARSRGMLTGTGLAITGIVLGLLSCLLWMTALIGANAAAQGYRAGIALPAHTFLTATAAGDYEKARAELDPTVRPEATDQVLRTFAEQVTASAGKPKALPDNIVELFQLFISSKNAMQRMEGKNNVVPVALPFEKGTLVAGVVPPRAIQKNKSGGFRLPIANLSVMTGTVDDIWLFAPTGTIGTGGAVPASGGSPVQIDFSSGAAPKPPELPTKPEEPGESKPPVDPK